MSMLLKNKFAMSITNRSGLTVDSSGMQEQNIQKIIKFQPYLSFLFFIVQKAKYKN